MKPKQRIQQKQSARLFLRTKDHRDVIFEDKYHYGIWAKTENIDDELVWVKYPNNALMFYAAPTFGWMDADRQFQYAISTGSSQNSGRLFRQRNGIMYFIVTSGSLSSSYCIASDNGVVWQNITNKFSYLPNFQYSAPMGEDSIAWTWGDDYYHSGGTRAHIDWVRITKDDDGEFQVEQKTYTLDCDISWLNWYYIGKYIGTINDKIIVAKEIVDGNLNSQQWFFSITRTGHVEMLSDAVPQSTWMQYFNGKMTVTQQGDEDGSRLFFVTASVMSHDGYRNWVSQVVAWMSMDGGATWTKTVLYNGETLSDYDPQHGGVQNRIEIFNRGGEIFVLFGQASNKDGTGWHETHLFSTLTGTQWDEIALPKWVEMPTITTQSGRGVSPSINDTIKVAIRPNETSGQNYNMFDLLESGNFASSYTSFCMDFAHGNTMWQDGELKPLKDTDFYMVIGTNPMMYFDNRYMAESSRAFAWYTTSVDASMDGADYIQTGDYCVRGVVT